MFFPDHQEAVPPLSEQDHRHEGAADRGDQHQLGQCLPGQPAQAGNLFPDQHLKHIGWEVSGSRGSRCPRNPCRPAVALEHEEDQPVGQIEHRPGNNPGKDQRYLACPADPLDQETVHQHQEGGDRGLGKHRGIQAKCYEKHGKKDDRRRYPEVIHKKMKIDLRRQGDDHADRQRRPPAPEYLGRNHHILRRFAAPFRYVLPSNEHNCSDSTPRKALLREMRGSGRLRLLTRLMLNS